MRTRNSIATSSSRQLQLARVFRALRRRNQVRRLESRCASWKADAASWKAGAQARNQARRLESRCAGPNQARRPKIKCCAGSKAGAQAQNQVRRLSVEFRTEFNFLLTAYSKRKAVSRKFRLRRKCAEKKVHRVQPHLPRADI
jgi:hypothetical protein